MKVYFMNEAVFDPTAMLTFGVSAKDSSNAIGYFGTGFKYAMAIILRVGGTIKVESFGKTYMFDKRTENIRGKDFDVVYMNNDRAGFTTHLGINWEPWMAFRELFSNCIDEKGTTSDEPLTGPTVITVECDQIHLAYQNRNEYFALDAPDLVGSDVDITARQSNFIYYRGVAVCRADSSFRFNLTTHIQLSEERTARYSWEYLEKIAKEIQSLDAGRILTEILTSGRQFDKLIPYNANYKMSAGFISTCKELLRMDKGIAEAARRAVREKDERAGNFPALELTRMQKVMLSRAIDFLVQMHIPVSDYPIKPVKGLGDQVMGRAHEGTIFISELPFGMGTKQVASTLLEEWVHLKFGCDDFDRAMQNWLFDKILSVAEELRGEPL